MELLSGWHIPASCISGVALDSAMFRFPEHWLSLFWEGSITMVLYVLIMLALVWLFYKKSKVLNFCGRYLTQAFVVVWVMGFVIYVMGMYPGDQNTALDTFFSLLGVAPMAIIHAFEMFLLQSDVSALHDGCHNSSVFMCFFSVAHFFAAFISMVFVIKHFGFNIVTSIIRYWKTHFEITNIQNLFVFWGMNDATYYLAKDIIQKGYLSDSKIVIVRIDNEKEGSNERLGMERLFSFLSMTKAHLEKLQELQKLGCLSTNTFGSLTNVSLPADKDIDIIRYELRLNSLVRLIHRTGGTLHMFFLDDNDTANIQALANLRRDMEIRNFASRGKVNFYCHARYNSVHRVIEDELTGPNIDVKVVDSSHISVELMKKEPTLHPANYVKVEKDATVSSDFNALVIGFGEVGLDTVRFLYEFGAFVKNGMVKVERSGFHCHVVDQNMDDLAGLFSINAPSIVIAMNRKEIEAEKLINLYKMDCRSVDFYARLKNWIKTLNYIVIATGDDETNISLAIRIFRLAIREREDGLDGLRIMVRVQYDENGHVQKIAEHYNRLWKANKNSTDKDCLHQRVTSSSEPVNTPLTLFGMANQVYTYDHVVKESLKEEAKKFKNEYDLCVNELKRMTGKAPDELVSWDEEQNLMMQFTGENIGYAPTFSGVMKLRRIQSQNIANSLHKGTKQLLAQMALGDRTLGEMRTHGLERKYGTHTYLWRDRFNMPIDDIQRVLDVLAQTEHLRWNASHEILGYRGMNDEKCKDEARLLHGCLKDWDQLSEETQSYDYNIVDVSLGIIDIDS